MSKLRRWAIVGLSLAALTGAARAQTAAPPPPGPAPGPAPAPASGPAPATAAPAAAAPAPADDLEMKAAPGPAPVEEQSLQSLDLFSPAGRPTGLPSTLWRGASASLARQEIGALAAGRPLTPAFTVLAWRVLATGANAPKGAGDDAGLAGDRVLALLGLGDLKAAEAIVEHTPNLTADPKLAQAAADTWLLLGRDDRACALLDSLSSGRDLPHFVRLRALCLAEAGKMDEAQLALELANQGAVKDAAFARLLGAVIAGQAAPGPAAADTAFSYALSRRLKLDFGPAVATALPAVLELIAGDPAQAPETRWAATYRGLRLGLVSADAAIAAYMTTPAATPAPEAAPPSPARRPGRLHRVAPKLTEAEALAQAAAAEAEAVRRLYTAADPADRLAALRQLVGRAGPEAEAPSRLVVKALAGLSAEGLAPVDRLTFVRAAVLAGALRDGQRLRQTLKSDEPDAVSGVDLVLLDAMISAARGAADRAVLDALVDRGAQMARGAPGDRGCQAAAALLAGLAAPGVEAMGEEARLQFAGFDLGPSGPSARLLAMDAAADAGVLGDVALFALGVSREGVLRPADRTRVVRDLAKAGDRRDAALTALEGIAALGGR